jgi:hypothetical protein
MGGQHAPAVSGQGVDGHHRWGDAQLHVLPGVHPCRGHGVQAGLERDQAVLADPAEVLVGNQVGHRRQRGQRSPVGHRPLADDLPVGAVHLAAADGQPRRERGVHLRQRAERPAGQHVQADDVDLPLDPALAGRAIGGGRLCQRQCDISSTECVTILAAC